MILYHGSNVAFEAIDLSKASPAKDFGCGFYMTDSLECAQKTSLQRVARMGGLPKVMSFVFDENAASAFRIKRFDHPCAEWALFARANRRSDVEAVDHNRDNRYDVVVGPIANDRISLQFRLFERGTITIDEFVRGLQFKELYTQFSFHTPAALSLLTYKEVLNVA